MYQNKDQPMTSEREFIIASLLNHSPDTALKLRTLRNIFHIKGKGGHYKTRAQKLLFLQRCHEQLANLPYDTQELQKIKQFIDEHSENLNMKKDLPTKVHYLKSAPVKPCACAECSQISHIDISSSLLDPYTLCTQLLPVLKHLENQEFQDKLSLILTFQCSKAKYILSQHLINFSISMCINDKVLHFRDEKTWIFPFYCEESHFYVQIEKNQIDIKSTNLVQFKPHKIKQLYFNSTSSVKNSSLTRDK